MIQKLSYDAVFTDLGAGTTYSPEFDAKGVSELFFGINATAKNGTPSMAVRLEIKGADGIWYEPGIDDEGTALLAILADTVPVKASKSIGAGMALYDLTDAAQRGLAVCLGSTFRIKFVVTGTGTPKYTGTWGIIGKGPR